jgi:proline dehydrogenase
MKRYLPVTFAEPKACALFPNVYPPIMLSAPPTQAPSISFEDTRVAFASKSDAQLRRVYALFAAMNNGSLVKTGSGLMKTALKWNLPGTKFLIKHSIFEQFCGGETIAECRPVTAELGKYNIGTILDYSVEGEGSDRSYDHTRDEILATIDEAHRSAHIPFSVFKVTGVANVAILEKIQAGQLLTAVEEVAHTRAVARVEAICARAHQHGVRLFVDAEESWFQHTIDLLAYDMMAKYNRETAIVWNTYQLYRHDRLDALKAAHDAAAEAGYYLGAKLVRGAYMEKEARVAKQRGQQTPINPTKQATDDLYDETLRYCVEHLDRISICAGTHNEASSLLLTQLMQQAGLAPGDLRVWFAQLYGMSDNLTYNLANGGYNTAKYLPYGPVAAVMPYLLRRADENTAIAGQSSREFLLVQKEIRRRQGR